MNNLEYLNQISKSNRPLKSKNSNSMSLIIKILVGGIVAFIFLLILGSSLGGNSSSPTDLTKQLYFRTNSLNSTISAYNTYLKSSQLRAIGSSLSSALTSASSQLSSYITLTDSSKDALIPSEKIAAAETLQSEELNTTLTNAKLNGILDRTYATQIQLQVALLLPMITQLFQRTDNLALQDILNQYASNLSVIEQSFENYSNPSD